jgi:hypothetical protein
MYKRIDQLRPDLVGDMRAIRFRNFLLKRSFQRFEAIEITPDLFAPGELNDNAK